MNQTITLSPEERKVIRAALASYRSYCGERVEQYNLYSNPDVAKQFQEMSDAALKVLSRIEE